MVRCTRYIRLRVLPMRVGAKYCMSKTCAIDMQEKCLRGKEKTQTTIVALRLPYESDCSATMHFFASLPAPLDVSTVVSSTAKSLLTGLHPCADPQYKSL